MEEAKRCMGEVENMKWKFDKWRGEETGRRECDAEMEGVKARKEEV